MSNNTDGENPPLSELFNIKLDWRRHDRASIAMKFGLVHRYAKDIIRHM